MKSNIKLTVYLTTAIMSEALAKEPGAPRAAGLAGIYDFVFTPATPEWNEIPCVGGWSLRELDHVPSALGNELYSPEVPSMDPLSVIASLAGISTAGLALSRAIYDRISSMRNAPTEMSGIAKSLCDLSFTLKELQRVLKDSQDIYKRKLIRRVASAVKRIGRVQREIELLISSTRGFAKLKWGFQKSKTIMLAVQLRQLPRLKDCQREAELARQQAENIVRVSYHSIQQVTSEIPSSSSPSGSNHDDSDRNEGVLSLQIETQNPQCFDNAIWLYDLVFSTTIKATADLTTSESEHVSTVDGSPGDASSHDRSQESSKESAITPPPLLELISQHDSSLGQLQSLMQKPPVASTVINELFSE
ncbi:hypothetical protein NUW58_g1982 [Xylaria curta]|uniref:Uncharacterized protein n=1 Tax=Xylaria curta TaxID=42375 RepID=A0ACC1PJQ1_9PEZI|nr:hypothetical protein NUW58_g1982 [Xylaria curta]